MDDKYEKLAIELEQQFPNCPFDVSCVDLVEELDNKFTDEPVIFIYDYRSQYWGDETDTSKWCHFLKVQQIDNKPITLRHVINTMSNDEHYNDIIVKLDSHRFLEKFILSKKSNIQYTCFWGS